MSAANDYSRIAAVTPDETHDYGAVMDECRDERNWFKRARGEWYEKPPHPDECPNLYLSGRVVQLRGEGLGWLSVHPGSPPIDELRATPEQLAHSPNDIISIAKSQLLADLRAEGYLL